MTNFDLIFDNAGGVQLQTDDGYTHHFDSGRIVELAGTVSDLLDGAEAAYWDGNEEQIRQEYSPALEAGGAYNWLSSPSVIEAVSSLEGDQRKDWIDRIGGWAEREFFTALFQLRDRKALQQ